MGNEHIVKWRRCPLIVHEILQYRPDVLCLQEVDKDVFERLLQPVLGAHHYEGYYSQKGVDVSSGIREGCAIFYSLDVFETVEPIGRRAHAFRELASQFCSEQTQGETWQSLCEMSDLLDSHEH